MKPGRNQVLLSVVINLNDGLHKPGNKTEHSTEMIMKN
jgi:hypothetical protein